MKWSSWYLPALMTASLSAVYFLPTAGKVAESAVKMELPGALVGWSFNALPPSEEELGTLPPDTEFAKAVCVRPRAGEFSYEGRRVWDRADVSIVLSGDDLNSSIHRPERCMPAQGHHIVSSRNVTLTLDVERQFKAKRLESKQTVRLGKDGAESVEFNCVTYYFFVGHDQITNDHLGRTLIDMKDRLMRGMDQRWAYVSASMWYGKLPWIEKEVTAAEADEKLQKFLTGFAKNQIDWKQLK